MTGANDGAAIPDGPWLNLGSGPSAPERWVNIDGSWQARLSRHPWLAAIIGRATGRQVGGWPEAVSYRDLRRGTGAAPASVAVVYTSHLLEHLYRDEALALLEDVHRSLKPHGVCRVVVPDVAAIVAWYLEHKQTGQNDQPSSDLLMQMLVVHPAAAGRGRALARWYDRMTNLHLHKWMYDAAGLEALVRQAGFQQVRVCAYLDSVIPEHALREVETSGRVSDGAGVCVEARR
jgi:SAM-dependent methyltransferase